jgi:carbon-monoxide dehydrogenase medium subunit
MIPPQFDYVRPDGLDEALRILREREGEAKVLAGGYSLIPLLKLRLAQPGILVDIGHIDGLSDITETADDIRVGARVTHRALGMSEVVGRRFPLVADAAGGIGDPQIRNWGTIGGSVAHADPSADWPAVLIATRASIVCRSLDGGRVIPARDFFEDSFQTAIRPDEILTEIRFPIPGARSGSAYRKIERKATDFATAAVGAHVELDGAGRVGVIGVGVTGVAEAPFAATDAEGLLPGADPSEANLRAAGAAVGAQSRPVEDGHGPVEFKRAMAAEMTVRALTQALARCRGEA